MIRISAFSILGLIGSAALAAVGSALAEDSQAWKEKHKDGYHREQAWKSKGRMSVQLGPRPYYLVDDMDRSRLKKKLESCSEGPLKKTDFSIAHRGAPLQFPEHTRQSYEAAARMGAGILECDVTFTKDRELVCRHAQCDLHTTTDILLRPELASKCTEPFTPAVYDPAGTLVTPASAKCCASDITLEEFKGLCGKMDAFDNTATTAEGFVGGTADWRTDLYATCAEVISHKESIKLFDDMGVKFTPELKSPEVPMPYEGDYTQEMYAQQMIDEYKEAGIHPRKVFAQSFNLDDVLYWVQNEPRFGKQGVFLDDRYDLPGFDFRNPATWSPSMDELVADGVKIIAPPMWMLLDLNAKGKIVPSLYAKKAKKAGLEIITWTLERSGPLATGGGWYHQSISDAIDKDGDTYVVLDVLAKNVGVMGVFSDWPATVSYYASCMNLK